MLTRAAFQQGRGSLDTGAPAGPVTESGISDTWTVIGLTFAIFAISFGAGWWVADTVGTFMVWVGAIVGLGLVLFAAFKPTMSPVLTPAYAVAEGIFIGGLSYLYESAYDGIVLQAGLLTACVFAGMWFMYASGRLRLTPKMQKFIIASTMAVMVTYLISWVLRIFGSSVPFIHDSGPIGIGISVVIVGIAALNLLIDFDYIDRLNSRPHERWQDWYAALGLLVTVVWIYIELLRLISKLRD